jgi:hypothetical protein
VYIGRPETGRGRFLKQKRDRNVKKYLLTVVLFFSTLVIFGQSRDDVAVFLAPVTGGTAEQQAFFIENFKLELIGANYTVADDQKSADYSINLNITQEVEDGEDGVAEEILNILNLSLVDNKDSHEVLQFSWAFASLEDMYEWNLHLIYQAMANIPLTKLTVVPDNDHWRNKWIYAAGYGGLDLNFGFYDSGTNVSFQNRDYTFYFGPLFGLGIELQFLNFMSAELGVFGSPYEIDAEHTAVMFGMPLLVKFPLKPSRHFMLEPYAGIHFNTSAHASIVPPLVSWTAGFQYGIKAGERGAVILDIRLVGDIGATKLNPPAKAPSAPGTASAKSYPSTERFLLQILVGYKVGFYNRNKDSTPARPVFSDPFPVDGINVSPDNAEVSPLEGGDSGTTE